MKRDMDLIRNLLLWIEADESLRDFLASRPTGEQLTEAIINGHVQLLIEAGFIEAEQRRLKQIPGFSIRIERITWGGHEFIDAMRSDTIWAKTKKLLKDKAMSVPATILQQLLVKLANEQIDL